MEVLMRIPKLPDWTKGLPNSTRIMASDIMEFFGYKTDKKSAGNFIEKGLLPPAERLVVKNLNSVPRRTDRLFWVLGELRNLRSDMLKEQDKLAEGADNPVPVQSDSTT